MVKMTTYAFPSDCIKLTLSTMFPICTKPPSAVMQAAVQLVDKVLCSESESHKSGIEIHNGESGPAFFQNAGALSPSPYLPPNICKQGFSRSAERDLGRCPKNLPTFEKVGSKLLF